MYVEVYNNNGKKHIRVVDSITYTSANGIHGSKKKLIKSIGALSKYDDGEPDFVQRLKESFKNGNPIIPELLPYVEKDKKEEKITVVSYPDGSPQCVGKTKLFSHVFLEKILEYLNIPYFISHAKSRTKIKYDVLGFFRLLIYGRILKPQSKLATISQNDKYYVPIIDDFNPDNIYDTLDFIYGFREEIQKTMHKAMVSKFGRTTNYIYYDVTNFYFEKDRADEDIELDDGTIVKGDAQYGVNKEERKLPIVQMGLFMDDQGTPVSIEMFPGNTLDHLTAIPAMDHTIDKFELSKFIYVGDRGMCTYKNICHLLDRRNGYVVSKSIDKSTNEDKEWIFNNEGYTKEGENFKYKSKVITKTVKDERNKKRQITEKVVVYWSKDYEKRQKAEQKKFLDFVNKVRETPQNFRITTQQYGLLKKFLKPEVEVKKTGEVYNSSDLKVIFDNEKFEEYLSHMGYYQIVSSELTKTDKEIIEIYHGLSRIEDQFRIMKGDLNTRPIYVRTHEHLYAHLLTCMIALNIVRIIQNKVVDYKKNVLKQESKTYWSMGLSGEKIREALNSWKVQPIDQQKYIFHEIDSGDLKLILDAFGIKIGIKTYTKEELRHIKQTINF